jgi:hypothetical protein
MNRTGGRRLDSSGPGYRQVAAGCCEHGNELSDFINFGVE